MNTMEYHPLAFLEHRCTLCPDPITVYLVKDLKAKAVQKCQLSRFVLGCIHWIENWYLPEDTIYTVLQARVTREGLVRVWVTKKRPSIYIRVLEFECLRLHRDPKEYLNMLTRDVKVTSLYRYRPRRLLPHSTDCLETFETIQEWLHECMTSHRYCPKPTAQIQHGSLRGIRFLHIDKELVRIKENPQPVFYAALSHCWGNGINIAKSHRANIAEHIEKGIPVIDLPKTFRDAVHICLNLGIEYLWIDSLCIIQDDAADWHSQAARMSEVYENSFLTIAASKASGPTEGCFSQIDWTKRGSYLPEYPDILIRGLCVPPVVRHRDDEQHENWPLYRRAWVYQELTLSPRVLHFGRDEVIWDCASKPRQGQSMSLAYRDATQLNEKSKSINQNNFQTKWYELVSMYSWRDLTFPSDRLPAIAALARQQQFYRPNDQYLAGLWKGTLMFDLMWYSTRDENLLNKAHSCEMPSPGDIPSWSWASEIGGVHWPEFSAYKAPDNIRVIDTKYTTEGSDVAGPVLVAEITIQAPRIPLEKLLAYNNRVTYDTAVACALDNYEAADGSFDLRLVEAYRGRPIKDNQPSLDEEDIPEPLFPQNCFVVPTSIPNPESPRSLFGRSGKIMLLLKKSDDRELYWRIGVVRVDFVGALLVSAGQFGADKNRQRRAKTFYHEKYGPTINAMPTHIMTLV